MGCQSSHRTDRNIYLNRCRTDMRPRSGPCHRPLIFCLPAPRDMAATSGSQLGSPLSAEARSGNTSGPTPHEFMARLPFYGGSTASKRQGFKRVLPAAIYLWAFLSLSSGSLWVLLQFLSGVGPIPQRGDKSSGVCCVCIL